MLSGSGRRIDFVIGVGVGVAVRLAGARVVVVDVGIAFIIGSSCSIGMLCRRWCGRRRGGLVRGRRRARGFALVSVGVGTSRLGVTPRAQLFFLDEAVGLD